jgi:hypothetical protein
LGWDVPDREAEILGASAWLGVHCIGGASAAMATMVFGAVSGMGARRERGTRRGGGVAALREDKEGRLGFRWDQKIRERGFTRLAWERQ